MSRASSSAPRRPRMAPAFVPAAPLLSAPRGGVSVARARAAPRVASVRRAAPRAAAGGDDKKGPSSSAWTPLTPEVVPKKKVVKSAQPDTAYISKGKGDVPVEEMGTVSIDSDIVLEKARIAVTDVTTRPAFYAKIGLYVAGGLVSLTVITAVIKSIESLPVLPEALELIGLGYVLWFGYRYVIFKENREELVEQIEDLLGRTTGRFTDKK